MAAAVIQDSALGANETPPPSTLGILLPIVRIRERVRLPPVLANLRDGAAGAATLRSWRWFFHHWQRQKTSRFVWNSNSAESRRAFAQEAAEPCNFLIHGLDAIVTESGESEKKSEDFFPWSPPRVFRRKLPMAADRICIVKNMGSHDVGCDQPFREERSSKKSRSEIAQVVRRRRHVLSPKTAPKLPRPV